MKKMVLFYVLFVMLLLLIPVDSVFAEVSDILICDFDDVSSGADQGISQYFNFTNVADANRFETSTTGDLSAPNSLKIHPDDTDSCQGYLNLTSSFDYIHSVNFSVYLFEGTGNQQVEFSFYNGSTMVVNLTLCVSNGAADEAFWWYDVSSGVQTIYAANTGTTRWYVIFTHNGTNQFHIELLNSVFAELADGDFAGASTETFVTFTHVYVHQTSNQPAATGVLYIDDFFINCNPAGEYSCDVTAYNQLCSNSLNSYLMVGPNDQYIEHEYEYSFTGTIYSVLLPISIDQVILVSGSVNDYDLIVNGVFCGNPDFLIEYAGDYALQWCDINGGLGVALVDEKPLLSFRCVEYIDYAQRWYWYGVGVSDNIYFGSSRSHNSGALFFNEILDGTAFGSHHGLACCFYYNASDFYDDSVPDWILDTYVDDFGPEFIQFYEYDVPCRYEVGDYPWIIYNLSNANFTDGDYRNPYIYRIYVTGSSVPVYEGFITFTGTDRNALFQDLGYQFSAVGQYIIRLYNTSDYGLTVGTLLEVSQPITVCRYGAGGDEDIVPVVGEDDDMELYRWIAGFGIVIGFAVAPVYLFKDNNFAQKNGLYVMLIFALLGLFIVNYYELIPFWVVYLIGIIVVIFMALSIYRVINRS